MTPVKQLLEGALADAQAEVTRIERALRALGPTVGPFPTEKKKRFFSPATRLKMAAAMKARWAERKRQAKPPRKPRQPKGQQQEAAVVAA